MTRKSDGHSERLTYNGRLGSRLDEQTIELAGRAAQLKRRSSRRMSILRNPANHLALHLPIMRSGSTGE